MSERKRYTREYKRKMVERVQQSPLSILEIATEAGIKPNILARWVREAEGAQGSSVAISSDEFGRRVKNGDAVRGQKVVGTLKLSGAILQTNWSNCIFDSTVEIEGCSVDVDSTEIKTSVNALDLSGCRFSGDLSLRNIKVCVQIKRNAPTSFRPANHASETPFEFTVGISLADATIAGSLDVVGLQVEAVHIANRDTSPRLKLRAPRVKIAGEVHIHTFGVTSILGGTSHVLSNWLSMIEFERSVVERSFHLEGGFWCLKCHAAQVNANMRITPLPSGERANQLFLSSARIAGDLEIEPHYTYCEEQQRRGYTEGRNEDEDPLDGAYVAIDAERLRVGGDASIGKPVFSDEYRFEPLKLMRMNLRRATFGNQLAINGVIISGWTPMEFDGHHQAGICLNQVEVGNCIVRKVTAHVMPPTDGDFARLLDMREMQARSDVDIDDISGEIDASGAGANALGIDLSSVNCRNLTVSKFEVKSSLADNAAVLEVYGDRLQVAGDATLGRREATSQAPRVRLPDSVISRLVLSRPLPAGKVELMGTTISRWQMGDVREDGDNETAANYLEMLGCSPALDVGQYVSIEQRLEALGHRSDADLVRRAMKRRQRREHLHSGGKLRWWPRHTLRWLVSLLHDVSLGYGTQVWRPAVLLIFLLYVSICWSYVHYTSWYQVSSAKLAELAECGTPCDVRRDNYSLAEYHATANVLRDAAGLSVRNIVPIIDIGLSAHLEPVRGSGGESWMQFLRVMGWITWPVLLTGILARLMPKRNQ